MMHATIYHHYTGQPVSADTMSKELEHFVGETFYCSHALADSNYSNYGEDISSPQ